MRHRYVLGLLGIVTVVGSWSGVAQARRAGLLPTQQRIRAIGKEVDLGLFPTGVALSNDGRLMLVTNNGFINNSLTVVDLQTLVALDKTIAPPQNNLLFIGVVLAPNGRSGYASGHAGSAPPFKDVIYTVTIAPGPTLTLGPTIALPDGSFAAGMAINPDGSRLYVAENLRDKLAVVDPVARTVVAEIPVGHLPWGVALHPSLPQAYVTNRADRTVSIVDLETQNVVTVPTGNGPNAVAVSPDGAKIFVADADTDDLTVFDVNNPASVRRISLSPFPGARPGSSPNALTFSPDGSRLYVANAWDNDITVVDPQVEVIRGLIPTGWYPTALAVSPNNQLLYVTSMKGARTYPRTPKRERLDFLVNKNTGGTYGVHGTLSVFPVPSDRMLGFLDRRVRQNNGFDTGVRPSNIRPPTGPCFPIPCGPTDITPIKHVVMIVRENKTYDQDLGDLPQGDGDPAFVLYNADVTTNLRKIVQEFTLLDHFFADSEKSEPGHAWTMGSIDSDYEEKTWTSTSFNGRPNDIGVQDPSNEGPVLPVAAAPGGYWPDNCFQHNVSFRTYGEFFLADDSGNLRDYWVNNADLNYRPFDLDYPDQLRFAEWKKEFDDQVANDSLPQFTYMILPQDHTKGTGTGVNDPRSFVADNDLATGKVVEAISNSKFWHETAIFILEDDSQSGSDHIDSHRTVGTVVSPWVRRGYVSHTRFDMASMHRTMELILGLPPMSQFDQMAIPMRELFTDTPDDTPYAAVTPPFGVQTVHANRGAALSDRQDWSAPDRVPDHVLNQLLWDYLKGSAH